MAVWLGRVLSDGEPDPVTASRFADVDAEEWWTPHVDRFADLGITAGCRTDPLSFCPDRSVTRAQMATFLVRALGLISATLPPAWSVFEIIEPPDHTGRPYDQYHEYYTQAAALGPLHIIADADVDPEALQRTALILSQVLANRPDVIEQLARWTYVIVGKTQRPIGTIPEVRKQALTEVFFEDLDTHIIGGGWGPSACLGCPGGGGAPYTLVSEANVLCSGEPIDTHTTEDVAVHELVHGIHTSFELEQEAAGIPHEESFDYQLQRLYQNAKASGIWEGHYAMSDHREYFAEMWQYWSGTNDNDYAWTMTVNQPFDLPRQRLEVAAYDPPITSFIAEHFGETPVTGSCHYYQ